MEVALCDRFPSFTPLSLRRERAAEVFKMVSKFLGHNRREKAKYVTINGKRMKKRKATNDNWF